MAQAVAAHHQRRLKYNYIVGQLDVVLNVEFESCPFISLETLKDKYARLFDGRDVQAELESLGRDLFAVVEEHFRAFQAMRDPNMPGLLRRNAIDQPSQSAQFILADGDNGVQVTSLLPAIEAPVEVMPDESDADAGGGIEAVPDQYHEHFADHPPPPGGATILTEERLEQCGNDSMDRIPALDDVGMPSARRVLPIVKSSPNNQSQPATRLSPACDRQQSTPPNQTNAATRSPSARHKPHFPSGSEKRSAETRKERLPVGGGSLNVSNYFDEHIVAPIRAQQSEVPAPEPQEQQKTVKKATEEKLKAMYAGRHYTTFDRQVDDADFACDNSNHSRQQPVPRFGSVFGVVSPHRTDSAAAPQNAGQKSPGFKISFQQGTPPAEASRRAETAPSPPDFTSPSTALPTDGFTAALETDLHSSTSTTSVVEDENSSSDFHTAPSGPLERSDSGQDVFGTANDDSEEEDTRTLRPSVSSMTADTPDTPKASRSTTAPDESAGGTSICLEQFGLQDLLAELAPIGHPSSQPAAASAASIGSTPVTGTQPALIARNLADDFFGSLEYVTAAPSATAYRNDAVDLECFATDFLEELPHALSTQELHSQSSQSPAKSSSPAEPPACHMYLMRDAWRIDNYEAASEERRRLCEESADFRKPPPEPVRDWIDQVDDLWVLLDILLDLNCAYPEGFTPDEFAEYEYGRACSERRGIYHWAATTMVIGLHRMLELRMITVDAASRKLRVNEALKGIALMGLPNNFCSNFYRYLADHGEMEVRQALKLLKLFEPPPNRLSDRDLLHLINHFPRVFILECKDKEHDFLKATVKLNPDLPKWRVVLDWSYPDYSLFVPIPDCPHPNCNGPW